MKTKTSKLKKIACGLGVAGVLTLGALPKSTETFTGTYKTVNEIAGMGLVSYTFDVNGQKKQVESTPSGLEKGANYHVTVKKPFLPLYSNKTTFEKQ